MKINQGEEVSRELDVHHKMIHLKYCRPLVLRITLCQVNCRESPSTNRTQIYNQNVLKILLT